MTKTAPVIMSTTPPPMPFTLDATAALKASLKGKPMAEMFEKDTLFSFAGVRQTFGRVATQVDSVSKFFQLSLSSLSEEVQRFNNDTTCTNEKVFDELCVASQIDSASLGCEEKTTRNWYGSEARTMDCSIEIKPQHQKAVSFEFKQQSEFPKMQAFLRSSFPALLNSSVHYGDLESLSQYAANHSGVSFVRKLQVISSKITNQARALFNPLESGSPQLVSSSKAMSLDGTLVGSCNETIINAISTPEVNCSYHLKTNTNLGTFNHAVGQFTAKVLNSSYLSASDSIIIDHYESFLTKLNRSFQHIDGNTTLLSVLPQEKPQASFTDYLPSTVAINGALDATSSGALALAGLGVSAYYLVDGIKWLAKGTYNEQLPQHRRVAAMGSGIINLILSSGLLLGTAALAKYRFSVVE